MQGFVRESTVMQAIQNLETSGYIEPTPCNFGDVVIAKIAEEIASAISLCPGASLEDVVNDLGGSIDYNFVDPWSDESGSIEIDGEADFKIFLPHQTSDVRDRFTIAHELGHYFLHYLFKPDAEQQPMRARRFGSGLVEYEANMFAASFLMPESIFKEKHKELEGEKLLVADYFKVSLSAAAVRMKVLGLD